MNEHLNFNKAVQIRKKISMSFKIHVLKWFWNLGTSVCLVDDLDHEACLQYLRSNYGLICPNINSKGAPLTYKRPKSSTKITSKNNQCDHESTLLITPEYDSIKPFTQKELKLSHWSPEYLLQNYLRAYMALDYWYCMNYPWSKIDLYNLAVWSLYLNWLQVHKENTHSHCWYLILNSKQLKCFLLSYSVLIIAKTRWHHTIKVCIFYLL